MQFLGHSSEAGCSARLVRQKSARSGISPQSNRPRRRAAEQDTAVFPMI